MLCANRFEPRSDYPIDIFLGSPTHSFLQQYDHEYPVKSHIARVPIKFTLIANALYTAYTGTQNGENKSRRINLICASLPSAR